MSFTVYQIQSNQHEDVIFETKKMWLYIIGDLLKEVEFICNFL